MGRGVKNGMRGAGGARVYACKKTPNQNIFNCPLNLVNFQKIENL